MKTETQNQEVNVEHCIWLERRSTFNVVLWIGSFSRGNQEHLFLYQKQQVGLIMPWSSFWVWLHCQAIKRSGCYRNVGKLSKVNFSFLELSSFLIRVELFWAIEPGALLSWENNDWYFLGPLSFKDIILILWELATP